LRQLWHRLHWLVVGWLPWLRWLRWLRRVLVIRRSFGLLRYQ
jgi:hypothetical protein